MAEHFNISRIPVSRFDTNGLSHKDRFETWQQSIGVLFDVSLDKNQSDRSFDASLTTFNLNSLLIAHCVSRKQAFERSALKVSHDALDHYLIQIFLRGQVNYDNHGKQLIARPGDVWVNDLTTDYSSYISDYENLTLVVPRDLISKNLLHPDSQGQRVIQGHQPLARLFKQMMFGLYEMAPQMTLQEGSLSISPLLRMTEGLLNSHQNSLPEDCDRMTIDQAMLTGLKRFIHANLQNPSLNPDYIVQHMGVSRSGLYRLFEPFGGVAAYIRNYRLKKTVRELVDPTMKTKRIYEIAHAWGFTREGDFSRAFRRAYGLTPKEVRNLGVLCPKGDKGLRGSFGDRNYETWLHNLTIS